MSINDRLGLLCALHSGERGGADFEPLSDDWLEELALFNQADLKDVEDPDDGEQ